MNLTRLNVGVPIFCALEQSRIQRLRFESLLFMYIVLIHLVAACAKVAAPQRDGLKKKKKKKP